MVGFAEKACDPEASKNPPEERGPVHSSPLEESGYLDLIIHGFCIHGGSGNGISTDNEISPVL